MATNTKRIEALEAILSDLRGEVQRLQERVEQLEDLIVPDHVRTTLDQILGPAEYEQQQRERLEGVTAEGGDA